MINLITSRTHPTIDIRHKNITSIVGSYRMRVLEGI